MCAAGRSVAVLLQFQPGLMINAVLGSRVVPTLADRTLHRNNDARLFFSHISIRSWQAMHACAVSGRPEKEVTLPGARTHYVAFAGKGSLPAATATIR